VSTPTLQKASGGQLENNYAPRDRQKGMPKPEPKPKPKPKPTTPREPGRGDAPDQGIVRDERGQEQPRDKDRAQQVSSRTDPIQR
jgi:hypothetical protein